jgi:hypothetical protein
MDYNLLNMNNTIYLAFLLLIFTNTQVIRVPTLTTTANTTLDSTIVLRTQAAFVYHGTVDIQITDGEQKNLDFYVHLVPET